MKPEDKVKEYIERAVTLIDENYPEIKNKDGDFPFVHLFPLAQMLQREEHYQKSNNK